MKHPWSYKFFACAATALAAATPLFAQAGRGDWAMTGSDPGQSNWQKTEVKLSPDSVPTDFKFLWKIQLGKPSEVSPGFTEPLLASRLINSQGFKDFVYWTSSDTLYAVDSELGQLLWSKKFSGKPRPHGACAARGLSIAMEPPVVINFNARRASGTPPPAPVGAVAASERRLGVPAGGGYFALKGIYALTQDGMLHEQVLTTGADFGPSVNFLPTGAGDDSSALVIQGKTAYAAGGLRCRPVTGALWSIDVAEPDYPVMTYSTAQLDSPSVSGPAVGPDNTVFLVSGAESTGVKVGRRNSIVAVDREMKIRDWYTPARATVSIAAVTATTFAYKGKQYVVGPGGDGSIVLLDAASLGGTSHNSPLAQTASFSAPGAPHTWDGFATYIEKSGMVWIYASISAPITNQPKEAMRNGVTPHGGIVAFRIDDADNKPVLTPVWISRDLVNPAPPALGGGVLIALAGGDKSTHANLYVLDASTGKELFASEAAIPTYTHMSGVSIGDGHVFFADHNGTLYSFGIGLEH